MRTLLAEPFPPQTSGGSLRRPRLGFLGAGPAARRRLEAIAKSGAAEIAAIADPAGGFAAEAARIAPGIAVLSSLDALMEVGLDGMVIATPGAVHAESAIAALERGMAVFCDPPLGRNAEETRRVIAAARAANVLLGVDRPYRFITGARKIHELCRSGELGDLYIVDLTFHHAAGREPALAGDRKLSGGGCVIDLGLPLLDLALWNLGFPPLASATSRLFARGIPIHAGGDDVEDYATARLDLANGATIRLACSWKLSAGCDAIISAAFYGTKGGAAFQNVDGSFDDFIAERFHGTKREMLACSPELWSGRAAVDWAQRLANGATYDPEIETARGVAEALDAIYDDVAQAFEPADSPDFPVRGSPHPIIA